MKFATKTALGIDISDGMINMALISQNAKGTELLKAASVPVPEGAIKDGNIENPAKLAKAIKELRTRNKIKTRQAGISLFTKPVVLQIFNMPRGERTNAGHFVRDELKSYVMLSGVDFASDFCQTSSDQDQKCRILAAATDCQNIDRIAQTADMAGLNIKLIEPAILSYTRALYKKKIEGKYDCGVLIAVLHNGILNICVVRKQMLEFIRVENLSPQQAQPDEISRWLPGKINEIIRSYDVEAIDDSGNWEITVIVDSMEVPQGLEQSLKTQIQGENIHLRNRKTIHQDMVVEKIDNHEKASAVAVALGAGLLNQNDNVAKINLVPPESAEVRTVKKQVFATITIIAAMPLFMVLTGAWFSSDANNIRKNVAERKKSDLTADTYSLLKEQEQLDKQIKQLSDRPQHLDTLLGSRQTIDWANILEDIKKLTPKTVRIINLYSRENAGLYLEGLSTSYESIHLFVEMLNSSNYISSATLNETTKDEEREAGLIMYTIICSIKPEKEEG
jgi:Tfp pilus assembly protein PilN